MDPRYTPPKKTWQNRMRNAREWPNPRWDRYNEPGSMTGLSVTTIHNKFRSETHKFSKGLGK